MKLVYIAGPYRAKSIYRIRENIRHAQKAGDYIIKNYSHLNSNKECWYPVIPHKNTEYCDELGSSIYFIEGTKELMRKCDAVVLVGNWQESEGSIGEALEACTLGIPVYENLTDFDTNNPIPKCMVEIVYKNWQKKQ